MNYMYAQYFFDEKISWLASLAGVIFLILSMLTSLKILDNNNCT